MVTPLIRKSNDIGIFANKSKGKTMLMTFLGLLFYLRGAIVFSNYWVKYPHIFIESLRDLDKIKKYPLNTPKVFLAHDFERWVHSRKATSKLNIDISTIILDFGKCNCTLIYDSKRPMAIDISLRDTTDVFIEVDLILPFYPNTGNSELDKKILEIWSNDLEMLMLRIQPFDCNLNPLSPFYLYNLHIWGTLYHTQEFANEIQS